MPRQGNKINRQNHNVFLYYMKRVNARKRINHHLTSLPDNSGFVQCSNDASRRFTVRKTKTLQPSLNHKQRRETDNYGYLSEYQNMKNSLYLNQSVNHGNNHQHLLKFTHMNAPKLNENSQNMRRLSLMFATIAATTKSERVWKSMQMKPLQSNLQSKRNSAINMKENPEVQLYTTNEIFVLKKHKKIHDKMPLIIRPDRQNCTIKYRKPQQSHTVHKEAAKNENCVKLPQTVLKQQMYRNDEFVAKRNETVRHSEEVKFINSNQSLQPWISITEEETKHHIRASPLVLI